MADSRPSSPSAPEPAARASGALRAWFGLLCVASGLAFLLNPGAGVLELVPDTAPLIGNLDEAAATAAVLLGVRLTFWNKSCRSKSGRTSSGQTKAA
jgi:hypothetical protein